MVLDFKENGNIIIVQLEIFVAIYGHERIE